MLLSLEALKQFASPRQLQYLEAIEKHGSQRAAARHLGVSNTSVDKAMAILRKNAALHGAAPLTGMQPVPAPFLLKGESLLHNKRTGEDILVWRKTKIDDAHRWEMIREAIDEACKDVPRVKATPAPKISKKELCNLYTITDYHLGQYSWSEETLDEDWDLKIAEELLVKSFKYMIDNSPEAETAFFAQLGDFLHADNYASTTPASGHLLDVDGRYPKVAKVAIRVIRCIIDMMLKKHKKVVFCSANANHDPIGGGVWLRELIRNLYESEPRVEVVDNESSYYIHVHGSTLLAFHHGHLTKMEGIDRVIAHRYHQQWGETRYRYAHLGHFHHHREIDNHGMHIMQHPTLAAMDAYAAKHGYSAQRRAYVITYSSSFGEVGRIAVDPRMFK